MADTKISALTASSALVGTDVFPIYDGTGTTKGATLAKVGTYLIPPFAILTSNYTLTNTAASQKIFNHTSNGALTLAAGYYEFEANIYVTGMSGTSGNASFNILGAGTAVVTKASYSVVGLDSTDNDSVPHTTTGIYSNSTTTAASMTVAATGTILNATIKGSLAIGTGGTIIPSIALVTAAAAVVNSGSYIKISPLGSTNYSGSWS